ncbi:MAG: DNA-processing protein DprA, partial [Vampirovibrionia bacterium]
MSKDLKYWLAFNNIEGLGAVSILKIWKHFKSIKEGWSASSAEFYEIDSISNSIIEKIITQRSKINPDKLIEELNQSDVNAFCITDSIYPERLKEIYDPPVVLYYKGNIDNIDFDKSIAIVGTRTPTDYSREMSYKISKDASKYGITIVSGLAEGIDTCAHTSCIENKNNTIAVLGSGLNNIYPRSNINLAKQIVENNSGILISEYAPDTKPDSWRFPYRNRI